MTNLVIMKDKQAVTSSLQIAESFEKRHDHILRDVQELEKDLPNFGEMFFEGVEPDSYGRDRKVYYMNRDGFALLAMGFTGKVALSFKVSYIQAFNELEKSMQESATPINNTKLLLMASLEHEEKIDALTEDVSMLKSSMRIDGVQEYKIKQAGNKKVMASLGGYGSDAYHQLSKKTFARFWRDFKNYFSIPRYGELPKSLFDEALEFIDAWTPDTETRLLAKQANAQSKLGV